MSIHSGADRTTSTTRRVRSSNPEQHAAILRLGLSRPASEEQSYSHSPRSDARFQEIE